MFHSLDDFAFFLVSNNEQAKIFKYGYNLNIKQDEHS